jgi:hypothetical protein
MACIAGDTVLGCSRCDETLCRADENSKEFCARATEPVASVNLYAIDAKTFVNAELVFRTYACPSCGVMLATGIELKDDSPHWELRFEV